MWDEEWRETGLARGKGRHSGGTKEKSIKRAQSGFQAEILPCWPQKKPGNPTNVFNRRMSFGKVTLTSLA